jgi:hypothetical protein
MTVALAPDWNIAPLNGLSQVKGRTDATLSEAPIHRFLLDTVQRFADRPAVVFREQGVRWTWAQFQAEVDALAAGFIALGLRVGDRVGIWSPNRVEWLVTQFATARAGLVLVNINPAYRIAELEYALNLSGCRALVTAEQLKTSKYLEMLQRLAPELATCAPGALKAARMPALEMVIRLGTDRTPGMLNYDDVLASGRARADRAALDALDAWGWAVVPRRHQHPVHQRHHRQPQGRHAHAPQRGEQRALHRPGHELHRERQPVHPRAAVPLLRHGAGRAGLRLHGRRHGVSRANRSTPWPRCRP